MLQIIASLILSPCMLLSKDNLCFDFQLGHTSRTYGSLDL